MAKRIALWYTYKRIHGYNEKKKKKRLAIKNTPPPTKQNPNNNKESKKSLKFQAWATRRILMPLV